MVCESGWQKGGEGRGAGVMEGETAIFRKGGAPSKQQEWGGGGRGGG